MQNSPHTLNLPKRWEVEAELCRRRFFFFIQTFWDTIIPEDPVFNWHIPYLADELQKIVLRIKSREQSQEDIAINIPPGTSKSTICTIMLPAWAWTVDPTIKVITGSHSDTLAMGHAVKSRDVIRSDRYQQMFSYVSLKKDQDSKTFYENTNNGARIATSVGAGITGQHAHLIIIDDPINPRKAESETERKAANDWMDKTLSTRKIDKKSTTTILIQQRLHENDTTGHLLAKPGKKVKHICLPGELADNVAPEELKEKYIDGLLDPVRLDKKILAGMRIDLGSYGYAGQVSQRPSPEEGGIIKKAWFGTFTLEELTTQAKQKKEELIWSYTVDGAFTKDEKNAQSAVLAYTFFNNQLYIRDVIGVWEETPEFKQTLMDFVFRNAYSSSSAVYIEPKATGLPIAQMLKRETIINIIIDKAPTEDKVARVRSITPFLESRRCHLLRSAPWVDDFIHQCASFPNAQLKDKVDCLVIAIKRCQENKGGITTWGVIG